MKMKVNPYVFYPVALLILVFVIAGAVFAKQMETGFGWLQNFVVDNFGWFYIIAVAAFLLFVIYIAISRYGKLRLGGDDEQPEFSYFTWFAMLFSAGMGIGLVFYGVAEPLLHFGDPPYSEPRSADAAREAINITFFHWGLHAWAIYIVIGLSLSYFAYRHGLPLTIRSTLYPILGRHIHGPIGHVVDILAVFGTVFGLATSLGLGVMQINAGLNYLMPGAISISVWNQVGLIVIITLAATVSVVSGVGKGIRRLSELNLGLATLLLLFVFIAGPTVFLLNTFVQGLGRYAGSLVPMTFRTDAFIGLDWQKKWTMFYWGWWISWSPFVGMFIARVSRGRTIREFVTGVLLVPTLLTFFWMVVFGGTGIALDRATEGAMFAAVDDNVSTAVFVMLEQLPMTLITTVLTTMVVAVFFVTSSDSGSLVVDILTSGGDRESPPWQKVFWALLEGAVAAILLVAGGLAALQTAAITTALPFAAIMLLICFSLHKGLRAERTTVDPITELWGRLRALPESVHRNVFTVPVAVRTRDQAFEGAMAATLPRATVGLDGDWRRRLRGMVQAEGPMYHRPAADRSEAEAELSQFMEQTVLPAFEQLKQELDQLGRGASIERDHDRARLTVFNGEAEEFTYAIRGHIDETAAFAWPEFDTHRQTGRAKAEVLLRSGRHMDRPVTSLSQDKIIDDFLSAYAKWMGW
jgi:choline/glycine/proline betaine transport protein